MANLCDYTMHVIGTLDALNKLTDMMDWKTKPAIASSKHCADLDASGTTIPLGPDGGILKNDDGEQLFSKTYYSATRWSVLCGMIDVKNDDDAVNIQTAAKQLELDIEIYSEEEGNQFAEYVTITPDGGYNVDCVDYAVMYLDDVLDELGSDASEADIKAYIAEAAKDLGGTIDIDKAYAHLKAEESLPIGGFEGYHPFPLIKTAPEPSDIVSHD